MKRFMRWAAGVVLAVGMGAAGAQDTLLGAGDVVKVTVFNNPDLAVETRINESGVVSFPLIGQVTVGGLSTAAAEKKIAGLLDSGGFVRNPQVNLLVTQLTSQQVSVLGQVNRPGRYPLEGRRNLLDLLAQAGGISADGGDTVVLIRKQGGQSTKEIVDVVGMVRSGALERNLELSAGDVLYVERAPHFYIYGEVQRPGAFRLERQMTLVQALSTGGGLTVRGTERGIIIKRRDASGKLENIKAKHDDLLQNDDVVYVSESLF
ncbi:polysaccharide export protein EpsE [Duganella sp. FT80W]|uniref:Polysaccharide export protein EpsE n=1 Tax=Duganella guangzhouensis TaxID=2666084 RepID=A0A6I2L4G1_9BURK|nr:polysaccharide export protein EpsE [Duganella guangzhouensis]MRW93028.1 polysaccharide export protein EpsE [Duganella guangzhouensis]